MSKKCTNCGKTVENTVQLCPKCNNIGFEQIPDIELSPHQLGDIAKAISKDLAEKPGFIWSVSWRVSFKVLAVLGLVTLFTGGSAWELYKTFRDSIMQDIESRFQSLNLSSSNQIVAKYGDITNNVAVEFQIFAQDASNRITSAYSAVTNQIALEFQTPRVKETVENVAKGETSRILNQEIQPTVNAFRDESEFIRTIARAQAHDFKSYQQLIAIATGTNQNAGLANEIVDQIDRSLQQERESPSRPIRTYMTYVGTNTYGGPFASDELALAFHQSEHDRWPFNREGYVNTLTALNQPLFLPQLVEFFTNETDLDVADRLTIAISSAAKTDFHPHDYAARIQTWWSTNQSHYTNWPLPSLEIGLIFLQIGQFSHAADSFQNVLQLDPSADMSRALAICSLSKLGQTNKVAELAKGFKDQQSRWAKWAAAFVEYKTGSVSNATVQFAQLARNNPTLWLLPMNNSQIWSNIDWPLYRKLYPTSK